MKRIRQVTAFGSQHFGKIPDYQKVVIVGGGAMGSFYASRLALSLKVSSVWLLSEQKEQIQKIQSNGYLKIDSLLSESSQNAYLSATEKPEEIYQDNTIPDLIFVLVKNHYHSNIQAVRRIISLAKRIEKPTIVVNLQNGLSDVISDGLVNTPNLVLLRGITSQAAYLKDPGEVVHSGSGPTYLISSKSQPVADLLNQSCLESYSLTHEFFQIELWKKLFVNCVINPLTAIYDIPNGGLLDPKYQSLIHQIIKEVKLVSDALGINTGDFEETYSQVMKVIRATGLNISSMRADTKRNSITEIDSLNGYVASQAKRHGILTPLNDELINSINSLKK